VLGKRHLCTIWFAVRHTLELDSQFYVCF